MRLVQIQELKRQGKSLSAIRGGEQGQEERARQPPEGGGTESGQAQRICLAKEGVWLEVAPGIAGLTSAKVDRLAAFCRRELGLDASGGRRLRILVRSKKVGAIVIPRALADGSSLQLVAGQTVEIGEVTPELRRAEEQDLIEIEST